MALTREGLTASDAEEVVGALAGENRSAVKRVGAFDVREWKFGALVVVLLIPLGVLYFAGGVWFFASLLALVSVSVLWSGASLLRDYLSGATRTVQVRPRLMGIPLPVTFGTNAGLVAVMQMVGGLMIGWFAWLVTSLAR